jgi:hypothetical protein
MERTSSKHNPRLDDELKHETEPLVRSGEESHVEEFREQEPPGDHEPEARYGLDAERYGGLGPDPVSARRELSRHLPNAFPADRERLLEAARAAEAPQEVLDVIGRLPAGQRFETVHDAFEALFGPIERDSDR